MFASLQTTVRDLIKGRSSSVRIEHVAVLKHTRQRCAVLAHVCVSNSPHLPSIHYLDNNVIIARLALIKFISVTLICANLSSHDYYRERLSNKLIKKNIYIFIHIKISMYLKDTRDKNYISRSGEVPVTFFMYDLYLFYSLPINTYSTTRALYVRDSSRIVSHRGHVVKHFEETRGDIFFLLTERKKEEISYATRGCMRGCTPRTLTNEEGNASVKRREKNGYTIMKHYTRLVIMHRVLGKGNYRGGKKVRQVFLFSFSNKNFDAKGRG